MITEDIIDELFRLQDEQYRDFQIRLIPTIRSESMIGVRTPELRKLAKRLVKKDEISSFLNDVPHRFFDENQLHAFIISEMKDYGECMDEVNRFLPYIDNWATCDQLSPKVFRKCRHELLKTIPMWMHSDKTFTVRFGIGMLMEHFLDEDFDRVYPEQVAEIRSEEYYVNMMIAWYFATALAKQYELVLPFIEKRKLDVWTHNKAIQKAMESFRISPERKAYLKSMKISTR